MRKLFLAGLIFYSFSAFSQPDTLISSIGIPDSIDIKYDRAYKLFVEKKPYEIKHLFKLNLFNVNLLAPGITYEQKLTKNISAEAYLYISYAKLLFANTELTNFKETDLSDKSGMACYSTGGYQMIKFYHNFNRRKLLDKNTNGFSGNYFSLKVSEHYSFIDLKDYQNSSVFNGDRIRSYLVPGIAYGMQRRIGNIGYAEISLTANLSSVSHWNFGLEKGITIKIGFSIESVSSLKMMLK